MANNKFITPEQLEGLKEGEELFIQLMQKALRGESSKFEFLRCWADRLAAKAYLKGVQKVVSIFRNLETTTYKTYLEQIASGSQDLGVILALKQFIACREFYLKEMEIAYDMLDEYKSYIWGGHMIDTLLNNYRTEEDLVDYRTLPVKWF